VAVWAISDLHLSFAHAGRRERYGTTGDVATRCDTARGERRRTAGRHGERFGEAG